MPWQSAWLLLGFALAPTAALATGPGEPHAALEADDQCSADGRECALNALQHRAVLGELNAPEEEAKPFAYDDVLAQPAKDSVDSKDNPKHTAHRHAYTERWYPLFPPKVTAQCCKCGNGAISWSRTGRCVHCEGKIKARISAGFTCQNPLRNGFPGGRTCAKRCLSTFKR